MIARKLVVPAAALTLVLGLVAAGCSTAPKTEAERENLQADAQSTLQELTREDPGLQSFLDKSHGYAVFPSVGKGGLGVGGAYGRGTVYEQGRFIGYADISQASIGLQAGGQTFSEVIAFENLGALDRFRSGKFQFSANASAVALKSGAAASAKYEDGVAVFVKPQGGLMFEASIGGQQFTFREAREGDVMMRAATDGPTTRPSR